MFIIKIIIGLIIFFTPIILLIAWYEKKKDPHDIYQSLTEGGVVLGSFVVGFMLYLGSMSYLTTKIPTHWNTYGEYQLYDLQNDKHIERQLSGKIYRDVEVNKYNYTIKQGEALTTLSVGYGNSSLVVGSNDFKVIIEKLSNERNFLDKFIVPSWINENTDMKYTFYVSSDYAKEKLGIVLGQ